MDYKRKVDGNEKKKISTPAHSGLRRCDLALEAGMRLGTGRTSAYLRMGQDAGGANGRRGSDWLDDDEYEGKRMNG